MTHPLLCVDDKSIGLDRRGVSVFGVVVQTKTPYIPVCLEWVYYEVSRAREQWAGYQKRGVEPSINGVRARRPRGLRRGFIRGSLTVGVEVRPLRLKREGSIGRGDRGQQGFQVCEAVLGRWMG